jgi:hypothetical protein
VWVDEVNGIFYFVLLIGPFDFKELNILFIYQELKLDFISCMSFSPILLYIDPCIQMLGQPYDVFGIACNGKLASNQVHSIS